MKHNLHVIMKHCISLTILTDFYSLFKIIVKSSFTTEKQLLIDVKAIKGLHNYNKITTNIYYVKTKRSIADKLTKLGSCDCLEEIPDT